MPINYIIIMGSKEDPKLKVMYYTMRQWVDGFKYYLQQVG